MGTGAMIFAILAQTGVYILLKTLPNLFFIFEVLGGLYLCYLAFLIFKYAKKPLEKQSLHVEKKVSIWRSFLLGLFTQLSNPKTAIVIGSIFAAFMPSTPPILSYFILALIAFCLDCGWYSIVAITLSTKKAQKTYIRYKALVNYLSAAIMLSIGFKLILSPSI
jgi:threonine/homoserine/homoserine lactone efflux protein